MSARHSEAAVESLFGPEPSEAVERKAEGAEPRALPVTP